MELPVGACFDCLKGSFVKKDPNLAFGKCMGCGRVTDCVRGDSIELFIPYVPLLKTVTFDQDGNHDAEQR
jgi:hypothetical protein